MKYTSILRQEEKLENEKSKLNRNFIRKLEKIGKHGREGRGRVKGWLKSIEYRDKWLIGDGWIGWWMKEVYING